MKSRREFAVTALLCSAGAGMSVTATGRTWATVQAEQSITTLAQELTGRELTAVAGALGWAGLAGLALLFAARGRVRAMVGALLALFGAGVAYASAVAVRHAHVIGLAGDRSPMLGLDRNTAVVLTGWWIISLAGGVLLVMAGVMTLVRGARWPGMSVRYEAAGVSKARTEVPAGAMARFEPDPAVLWKSLDQGEDPTVGTDDG